MRIEALLNGFLTATPEEQAKFLKLARGMKKSTREQKDEGAEQRLYEVISTRFLKALGIRMPTYAYVAKGTNARALLETAITWMKNGQATLPRATEQAMFTLAAAAALEFGVVTAKPSKQEILTLLSLIPAAINESFPGYRANGLLLWMAKKVAVGELPVSRSEEEEL